MLLVSFFLSVSQCLLITDNGIKYTVIDNTTVYVGNENSTSHSVNDVKTATAVDADYSKTDLVIPATVSGYQVVEIGSRAFRKCHYLRTVTIKANIRQISTYAFYECKNLTNINIPPSVQFLGYGAISCITETGATANGVLTIKFEPNSTIKYIDTFAIERKQVCFSSVEKILHMYQKIVMHFSSAQHIR